MKMAHHKSVKLSFQTLNSTVIYIWCKHDKNESFLMNHNNDANHLPKALQIYVCLPDILEQDSEVSELKLQ